MALRNARSRTLVRWALCTLPLLLAGPASAELTTILDTNNSVPGLGRITRFDRVAGVSATAWQFQVKTDNASPELDQALVVLASGVGSVLAEGDPVSAPAGATIDAFGPLAMDGAGNVFQVLYLSGTSGESDDTALYRNGNLLLQEGGTSGAAGFSAGTVYRGFLNVKVSPGGNKVLLVALVDDPAIPSAADLAIVVLDLDGAGNLVSETVIAKEDDVLPGQGTRYVRAFGTGRHQAAVNDAGDVMFFADLVGNEDTDGVIYLNGTILAQEGSPSPDSTRNYRTLASRGMDLNASAEWCFTAGLDGDPADDEVLVRNGVIEHRENQQLPGVATLFRAQNFGPPNTAPLIDDSGTFVWYSQWNAGAGNTGLFVNDSLTVRKEITPVDGGTGIVDFARVPDGVVMASAASGIFLRGSVGFGPTFRRGVFLLTLGPGVPLDAPRPAEEAGGMFLRSGPNPFVGQVQIRYGLDRELPVRLEAYDVGGRLVATLEQGVRSAGVHHVSWSGRDAAGRRVAPGVYFLRLRAGEAEFRSRLVKAE